MAHTSKPKGTPGKHRKPGEANAISAARQAAAEASGRLATVRYVQAYSFTNAAGSAKYQRLHRNY